ncbi:MAG TPA: polyprenyl diphosphate synthase [Polyangiales bacterium]
MLIDGQPLPRHVAIIMDGNGRWAKDRGMDRPLGHRAGMKSVIDVVEGASDAGLKALTLYAFSEQNWARPEDEVGGLMKLIVEYLISEREMFFRGQVRMRAIGRISRLPPLVRTTLANMEAATSHHKGLTLSLCLSYGGREEVADVVKELGRKVVAGEMSIDQVDEQTIGQYVPSNSVGPVDLLIRTGGEQRTSNFLIWAGVHAHLNFSSKLWPDYTRQDLNEAIEEYQRCRLTEIGEVA